MFFRRILQIILFPFAIFFLVVMRLIRPVYLIRIGQLRNDRIGHFAGNVELYLCEKDARINSPRQKYLDIFYLLEPVSCNRQLEKMWRRKLNIWPSILMSQVYVLNHFFPNGAVHLVGHNTQEDRDVHNLLEKQSAHLEFTDSEHAFGREQLLKMGIRPNAKFICMIVRDNAYLEVMHAGEVWNYHNYRDSDINNYILGAETLADCGVYVLRMGAVVRKPIKTAHPLVIDYAMNGMRTDFMDVYLGAHCFFCISVGTGFDAIPMIFRRPIAYVNMLPIGYLFTFLRNSVFITKHLRSSVDNHKLTLKEIIDADAMRCLSSEEYNQRNIIPEENTSEEIRDLVIEMFERLSAEWKENEEDEELQKAFWKMYPVEIRDVFRNGKLHGEIRGRYGAAFLREHKEWLN